jgi:hypothetical protein
MPWGHAPTRLDRAGLGIEPWSLIVNAVSRPALNESPLFATPAPLPKCHRAASLCSRTYNVARMPWAGCVAEPKHKTPASVSVKMVEPASECACHLLAYSAVRPVLRRHFLPGSPSVPGELEYGLRVAAPRLHCYAITLALRRAGRARTHELAASYCGAGGSQGQEYPHPHRLTISAPPTRADENV